jgi:hypothetical protein
MVMLARDGNRTRCFANLVKLTHALVRDLDEAIKEVKLLGENGEKASHKIAEMVAEGSEKVTRRGGEWESIKIPHGNLAYIPNRIRRPSLLTRPSSHSYSKTIGLWNRVRDRSGNTNRRWYDHMQDQQRKSNRKTVYILRGISPNIWWPRSGNHHGRAI